MSDYNTSSALHFDSRTGRLIVNSVYGNQYNATTPTNQWSDASTSLNSNLAETILNTQTVIPINETATCSVRLNGKDITGIWVNREECMNWRGLIPLEQYKINTDGPTQVIYLKDFFYFQIK